jgi:hypothetical protein
VTKEQEDLSAHRPAHDGPNSHKNGDGAIYDLIAQARALAAELEKLAPCESRELPQRLLNDYSAVAMRIISQTPQAPGEIYAILTFVLEDEKFRAVADERVAILIRSLLQSPVLAGEAQSGPEYSGGGLLQTSGVPREEATNEKRYIVCSDGRPITEVLNFVESSRAACDILVEQPEANVSIYDTITAIHYL